MNSDYESKEQPHRFRDTKTNQVYEVKADENGIKHWVPVEDHDTAGGSNS